jgi:hypothetical protein
VKAFFLFSFLSLFTSLQAEAEYRVFLLKISKPSTDPTKPAVERTVQSTLDPQQYRDYYPIALDETVTYTETWRCTGRTDQFKDLCPNPTSKKAQNQDTPVSNPNSP